MGKEPDEIRSELEQTRARMGETVEAIGYKADVKSRAKDSVQNTKDNVTGSIRNAKDRVVESIAGAKGSANDSLGNTTARVGDAAPSADQVAQQAKRAVGVAQENPLGLALGSFAVGFLAGMMAPSTRLEDEKIGPVSDQIKDTARSTGHEALERGRQVAQETTQVAKEAAQEAGQRVAEKAQESAQQQSDELASSAQENASDVAAQVKADAEGSLTPPAGPAIAGNSPFDGTTGVGGTGTTTS